MGRQLKGLEGLIYLLQVASPPSLALGEVLAGAASASGRYHERGRAACAAAPRAPPRTEFMLPLEQREGGVLVALVDGWGAWASGCTLDSATEEKNTLLPPLPHTASCQGQGSKYLIGHPRPQILPGAAARMSCPPCGQKRTGEAKFK